MGLTTAIAAGALVGLGLALMLAGLIRAEPPSSTGSSTPLWTRGVRRWTALTARRRVWLLGAIGTGVIGGMITATVLAIFWVPLFYATVSAAGERKKKDTTETPKEAGQ